MTRKKLTTFFLTLLFFLNPTRVIAQQNTNCDNRFLTLINPVRGRNLWIDQSLKPLSDQYKLIEENNFSASWLLQYDALKDQEIVDYIKNNFTQNQELGIFLEISPDLALNSRVIYPHAVSWYDPQAVFLSGYSQSERRKLINTAFSEFKKQFGYFPTFVGAWWIDSYSLNYIKEKYDIKTALIVADQKTTDDYGVWGQWWGIPYYPSRANILVPAKEEKDKQNVVILQWAQRDLALAYGQGPAFSNYSLQANDYTERELTTDYFKKLVSTYLDCGLAIGQITVGLETGIESVKSFDEYQNQLKVLAKIESLKSVTASEFADQFKKIQPQNPEKVILKDAQTQWMLTPEKRQNEDLKDEIYYQSNLAFADYFIADKKDFLERMLPTDHEYQNQKSLFVVPLLFLLAFFIYSYLGITKYYPQISLFIIASFLTTLMSFSKFGWQVYFGPALKNILFSKVLIIVFSFSLFAGLLKLFEKKIKNFKLLTWLLPLSFSSDFLLTALRYIQLNNQYYFGIGWDALRFIGLKVSSKSISFVNQDFSSVIANSFLKLDFNLIWQNPIIALIIYPLAHVLIAIIIFTIIKKLPKKLQTVLVVVISLLLIAHIYKTLLTNPRIVF